MFGFIWNSVRQFACLHSQLDDARPLKLFLCQVFMYFSFFFFLHAKMLGNLKTVLLEQRNGKWSTDETVFLNYN
jgi:hypothetical protein